MMTFYHRLSQVLISQQSPGPLCPTTMVSHDLWTITKICSQPTPHSLHTLLIIPAFVIRLTGAGYSVKNVVQHSFTISIRHIF